MDFSIESKLTNHFNYKILQNLAVFDLIVVPSKYWKNYFSWDWNRLERIIISPGIKISGKSRHEIVKLAEINNIYVIEDSAEALGSKIGGRQVGTFGKFGVFSLIDANKLQNL